MYRFTFHFELYGQGFSETLFRNTQFAPGEGGLLDNYLQKRLNLGCTDLHLLSVRSSNLDTQRDIEVLSDPTQARTGTWAFGGSGSTADPGTPTNAEDTFTALLTRLSDGASNFRSFALIGIPDYVLQTSGVAAPERPILIGRLNAWVGAMAGASLGMKSQGAAAGSGRILTFEDKVPTDQNVCLGISGAPPAVGSLVTLGSVKPFSKLNREWRVAKVIPAAAPDPAFIYLARSGAYNTYGPVDGGTWKSKTFTVTPLSRYTISRLTARKTGVPFGVVRGRR